MHGLEDIEALYHDVKVFEIRMVLGYLSSAMISEMGKRPIPWPKRERKLTRLHDCLPVRGNSTIQNKIMYSGGS